MDNNLFCSTIDPYDIIKKMMKRGTLMEHNTEDLEHFSADQTEPKTEKYTKRPLGHVIMAWLMIAIVLFGFLGTCYWLAFGRF